LSDNLLTWKWAVLVAIVTICALQTGCVQRRLTIRSNPPGAVVYVGNQEIGSTPISHDFVYYGSRNITLVKDGYETLKVKAEVPTPWYDLPGIDFISENLIPTEIRDHRVLDFQLQPAVIVPTEQLMGRAEELRRTRNPQATAPVALPGVAPAVQPFVPVGPPGTASPPPANPPATAPLIAPPVTAAPTTPWVSPARPGAPLGPPPSIAPPSGSPPSSF
jgi:hypothetical protein